MADEARVPFRNDWPLAENLRAQGFAVELAVTRADGTPLSDADRRTIAAATKALAAHDREVYRTWAKAAPSSPLAEERPAGKTAGSSSRARPKRAAAKTAVRRRAR